jgi:hypothetical protein
VLSYSTNLFQLIVYNPMEKKTATKMGYKKWGMTWKTNNYCFFLAVAYMSFVYVKYIHMSWCFMFMCCWILIMHYKRDVDLL